MIVDKISAFQEYRQRPFSFSLCLVFVFFCSFVLLRRVAAEEMSATTTSSVKSRKSSSLESDRSSLTTVYRQHYRRPSKMAATSKAPPLKYPLPSSAKLTTSYQDHFRIRNRRREDIVNPKQHRYYAIRNFFTSQAMGPKWFDCIEKEFVYCPRREYEKRKSIVTSVEQCNEIERQKPNHPDYKPPCSEKPIWEQYHVKRSSCHKPVICRFDKSVPMACRTDDPYTPQMGSYAPRYRQYQKLPRIEEEMESKDQS